VLTALSVFTASPLTQARRTIRTVVPLEVQPIGALAPQATEALRERMHDLVVRQLRVLTETHVLTSPHGYVIDGSIDAIDVTIRPDMVEISCSVRLILSGRRSGAMMAMTTGQATVTNPRRSPRPATILALLPAMQLEALDGAVRAASEELIGHFEARRKS
jgi:hypothetical protein